MFNVWQMIFRVIKNMYKEVKIKNIKHLLQAKYFIKH